jgi:hypothetical protein
VRFFGSHLALSFAFLFRFRLKYKLGKHRSNALELVHRVPIVEVEGEMAICDGGGGALGHPLEYIALDRPGAVVYCIWWYVSHTIHFCFVVFGSYRNYKSRCLSLLLFVLSFDSSLRYTQKKGHHGGH